MNTNEMRVALGAVLGFLVVVVSFVAAGMFATARTNARLERVQVACVQSGQQWVAGQCLGNSRP